MHEAARRAVEKVPAAASDGAGPSQASEQPAPGLEGRTSGEVTETP